MKKTSIIVKGIDTYEISILINNTALIKSKSGTSGLLDIKQNTIIGPMRKYFTQYDKNRKYYTQTWEEESYEDNAPKKITKIRIYDAKNDRMLVDDSELLKIFRSNYEVLSLKSPKDDKVHLYDMFSSRSANSIYNQPVDDVKKLLDRYNDTYYVLTNNGKKALYFSNCYDKVPRMITGFEYDEIEYKTNVLIFTKNGKKHFRFFDDENNKSIDFDEIRIEESNSKLLYGIKGGTIYVYNTESKELILQTTADEIEYLGKDGDGYNDFYGEYYFKITKDGKCGLLSSNLYKDRNNQRVVNQTKILETEYEDIERGKYSKAFYFQKNGKKGLIVGNGERHQIIPAEYDDITNLSSNNFALTKNGLITIKKVLSHRAPETVISECQSYESVNCGYVITKDGRKGLLITDSRNGDKLIKPEYDEINEAAKIYYIVRNSNKKGVISKGKTIIPVDYEEISLGGEFSDYRSLSDAKKIYFALKRNGQYELAKISNYEYVDCDVEFVNNHKFNSIDFYKKIMVLKDDTYTYIYSYDEKLLKTLPTTAEVTEIAEPINSCEKKYLYLIDGKYYYFQDGKFNEQLSEEKDLYVTKYESDTDVYEIRTLSKEEHDSFCSMIDDKKEEAEQALQDYAKNKQKVKSMFPTIELNRMSKVQEG